jgi:hypothetical protein
MPILRAKSRALSSAGPTGREAGIAIVTASAAVRKRVIQGPGRLAINVRGGHGQTTPEGNVQMAGNASAGSPKRSRRSQ